MRRLNGMRNSGRTHRFEFDGPTPGGRPARPGKGRRSAAALIAGMALLAFEAASAGDHYLRVGIGLDRPVETAFMDTDCSSTSPAALYGVTPL